MALVAGLIDNDEKVASSKKHTQFKTRAQKPYPIKEQNGQIDTLFMTKTAEKSCPLGPHIPT